MTEYLPKNIQTSRFILRPFEESDALALFDAARETQSGLFDWYGDTLSKPGLDIDQVKSYIQECAKEFLEKSFLQYGVFDTKNGELMGVGSLHHLDWSTPKGRIGYWVRSKENGKGIATEIANVLTHLAFNKLGMERIEIRAETRNSASGTVARKLGYQYLTVFEKNKRGPNGELWNLEIHVRLNDKNLPTLDVLYT